jgi:hypothetical protein
MNNIDSYLKIVMFLGLSITNYIMWIEWNQNITPIENKLQFDKRAIA